MKMAAIKAVLEALSKKCYDDMADRSSSPDEKMADAMDEASESPKEKLAEGDEEGEHDEHEMPGHDEMPPSHDGVASDEEDDDGDPIKGALKNFMRPKKAPSRPGTAVMIAIDKPTKTMGKKSIKDMMHG